ncbi:ATP-grasp domain-containing protein [Rubritalea marina]|uniref:ATP-grasp domain-containing protein n=1 Tax=Rubritalea marina TaxID=361055 RepID=UPI000376E970|nr:ATP-grasp domain-containing protein [Rubritalea marina]
MRVLLVDTSFAAVPIYEALLEMGHDVWVVGNRSEDVLALRAGDQWIDENYSDILAVQSHCDSNEIEAIVPGCTDVSIETCCRLQVPNSSCDTADSNDILADKKKFRALCARLNLPAPREVDLASFPQKGNYICKPIDAFSGRGVSKFNGEDMKALSHSCAIAEQAGSNYLIESYHEGQLYSCSAFIEDKKVQKSFYVKEGSSVDAYAVDTSYVLDDIDPNVASLMSGAIEKMASELNLVDGLFHVQFIVESKEPYIIEVARRCPGDLYSLLIEFTTGFSYAYNYAASFTSTKPSNYLDEEWKYILRHTVKSLKEEVYWGVFYKTQPRLFAEFPLMKTGETLFPKGGNRASVQFYQYESLESCSDAYADFLRNEIYKLQ